jgi:uncharacterized protein (TIGR00251 family)
MSKSVIWESDKGTFLVVVVRPGSREKQLVHSVSDAEIVINLAEPAREGRANTELIKRLSKALQVPSSSIAIVAGHKSRQKTLLLQEITASDLLHRLSALHNG